MTDLLPYPPELAAIGAAGAPFRAAMPAHDLPPGTMRRVTFGELDLLLAHTDRGVVATDARCPHMSAPWSIGSLEGCVVGCPLHNGRFDFASGGPVQMPTTGGLWPDGRYEQLVDGRRVVYTFDPELQELALGVLRRYKVPYGAFVAVEPSTGRVLALAEHSQREPEARGLSFRAMAPAASIFKIVTTAALLGRGVEPGAEVCYHGGKHGLSPW